MNYSQRYHCRSALFISILVISVILNLSLAVDNFLEKYKIQIEQSLSGYFHQEVFIGKMNYFPPNFILLKNIFIEKGNKLQSRTSLFFEKVKLSFSLGNILSKRNFVVTGIYLYKPKIISLDRPKIDFSDAKNDITQIIGGLHSLAKEETIRFMARDGVLIFPQEENLLVRLVINNLVISQKGEISSLGKISLQRFSRRSNLKNSGSTHKDRPVTYRFKGSLTQKGIVIDSLEFGKIDFYAKLWGALGEDVLQLNGFLFFGKSSDYSTSFEDSESKIISKAQKVLTYKLKPSTSIIWLSSFGDLNIFDLDCLIKFVPQRIEVERLNFSLNNIPLSLKGEISYHGETSINLKLSSYSNQPLNKRLKNPRAFDLEAIGTLGEKGFSGKVGFDLLAKTRNIISQGKAETKFKNLALYFLEGKRLKVCFTEANGSYSTDGNLYRALLKDFDGQFGLEGKKVIVAFNSIFYDGFLRGAGVVDITRIPFKKSFNLRIKDLSTTQLNSLSVYFSPFSGKLYSEIYIRNQPVFNLKGKLIILDGLIENLAFFNWLADFFGIEALKKIDFNKLSADFLINEEAIGLSITGFESQQLNFGGNFSLQEKDRVSGKLFLTLPKELLTTSAKFKPLLGLLDKNTPFVNFDFQVSGLLGTVNFKWLESDFKNKLQGLLPDFMKRGLERDVEDAVGAISEN